MGVSTKRLFAFAFMATMAAIAYGDARKCYYLAQVTEKKDAKPEKVTCANPDNKYCWHYSASGDGKTVVQMGCAGDTKYGRFPSAQSVCNGTGKQVPIPQDPGETDCCDTDYCNSAARTSLGFGLVTVAVAMLLGKAAI